MSAGNLFHTASLFLSRSYHPIRRRLHLFILDRKRRVCLSKIKNKDKIKVVFLALFDSAWKCDSLYRKMLNDERFEPIIVICPVVNYGRDNMIKRMHDCSAFFKNKGYSFIEAYDENRDTYFDIKSQLNPDIVVYTNPYKGLIHDKYYLNNFEDVLTCYIPYFYESGNDATFFDLDFHNFIWRYYVESDSLKLEQERKLHRKRKNVVSTGFCPFDEFKEVGTIKEQKTDYVTIIWAPHHLIGNDFAYVRDGFFKYHDLFFNLANKYQGRVHFIFRPHPLLKNKLEKETCWGVQKTREYYSQWSRQPYCSIEENSNYIELFKKSDALIHDCGSFITEYLYENKPALFTGNEVFNPNLYWQSAIDAIECYYRADSVNEVEKFVENVINAKEDYKKPIRENFIKQHLHPEYNVAQKIIEDILYSIDNQILYRN